MLTYTDEMREQDQLWETEDEDLDTMELLYEDILKEAKELGFKGCYIIYEGMGEMCINVFKNEDEMELAQLGKFDDYGYFGYCKPLIDYLEELLKS